MKIVFGNFQIQNWISQTVTAQKLDEKFFLSWVSPQIAQFCANFSKTPKYIKAIYFYPSERPHHALLENSIFL